MQPDEHAFWLLPVEVAIVVIDAMGEEPLAVVGGDVWVGSGPKSEIRGDWSCEKTANVLCPSLDVRCLAAPTGRTVDSRFH